MRIFAGPSMLQTVARARVHARRPSFFLPGLPPARDRLAAVCRRPDRPLRTTGPNPAGARGSTHAAQAVPGGTLAGPVRPSAADRVRGQQVREPRPTRRRAAAPTLRP